MRSGRHVTPFGQPRGADPGRRRQRLECKQVGNAGPEACGTRIDRVDCITCTTHSGQVALQGCLAYLADLAKKVMRAIRLSDSR